MDNFLEHSERRSPQDRKKLHTYLGELIRYQKLINLIPRSSDRIVDIGCGRGYVDYLLVKKGWCVTAVDISREALDSFKDISDKYHIKQINMSLFNLTPLNCDLVLCQEVLEHIDNYQDAIEKIYKLIESGVYGLFSVPYKENLNAKLITDPVSGKLVHKNGHLHSFNENNFVESFIKVGFSVLKIKFIGNKLLLRIMVKLNINVNSFTLLLDDLFNVFFRYKSTWFAVLVRK